MESKNDPYNSDDAINDKFNNESDDELLEISDVQFEFNLTTDELMDNFVMPCKVVLPKIANVLYIDGNVIYEGVCEPTVSGSYTSFEKSFAEWIKFYAINKRNPDNFDTSHRHLVNWVKEIRYKYHTGDLRPNTVRRLESRPGWEWGIDNGDGKFQIRIAEWKAFVKQRKRAPTISVNARRDERDLARWREFIITIPPTSAIKRARVQQCKSLPMWD